MVLTSSTELPFLPALLGETEQISSKLVTQTLLDVLEHSWTLFSFTYKLLAVIVTHLSAPQDVIAQ